jgi:hypothetical protein
MKVGTDGSSTDTVIKQWQTSMTKTFGRDPSDPFSYTQTQSGVDPSRLGNYLITNADQGALLSWGVKLYSYCASATELGCNAQVDSSTEFHLSNSAGGDTIIPPAVPSQGAPVEPVLQLQDGNFVGTAWGYGGSYMVKFDLSGHVLALAGGGYSPQIATADGGLIAATSGVYGPSGLISNGTTATFDANLNVTGQLATLPTYSWTENAYTDCPVNQIVGSRVYSASNFLPMAGANPSSNSTPSFFTKHVTIVGWIDKSPISIPPKSSVNSVLFDDLNKSPTSCALTVRKFNQGDRSLILSDTDRQYVNAFLITRSANKEPPQILDSSVLRKGDFRAYNEARFAINSSGNQITSAIPSNPKPVLGDTPDACNSSLVGIGDFFLGLLKSEAHPDNGKYGITPDKLHAFQLAEGRVGAEAQAVNMTLNSCTSRDKDGQCNAPVPPVTPYIWAFPLFDSKGNYTFNTQIFPTYYIYEDGRLVTKKPQVVLEDFIKLNATSQVKASDIK